MKRVDLIRHLREHGCEFVREGGSHSLFRNTKIGTKSTIPRHNE
ncbi:MAG TPA: type II toxin-antitoxin system HicA family toxin, partial [Kouleothrix sp.]|nr:type II toxin-antitoxin system HicA family toxin [Kouleothrix sp.]